MDIFFFFPEDLTRLGGTPFRIIKLAQTLGVYGYDVYVLATGIDQKDIKHFTFLKLKNTSFTRYFLSSELAFLLKKIQPDLLYSFCGVSLFPARISKKFHIPLIAEIHSLDPYSFLEKHNLPESIGVLLHPFMRFLVRPASHLIVVTPALQKFYQPKPSTLMIMGTDLTPPSKKDHSIRLPPKKNKIIAMYSGNFRKCQGVDLLFHTIQKLNKSNDTSFLFAFMGCTQNEFDTYTKRYATGDLCVYLGKPPLHTTSAYLSYADIFICPRISSKTNLYTSASKLIDYLAIRKPIICTHTGDPFHLLKGNGIYIHENPDELIHALHTISRHHSSYTISAQKYTLSSLTIQANLLQLHSLFKQILSPS